MRQHFADVHAAGTRRRPDDRAAGSRFAIGQNRAAGVFDGRLGGVYDQTGEEIELARRDVAVTKASSPGVGSGREGLLRCPRLINM